MSYGSSVIVHEGGTFVLSGAEISGNTGKIEIVSAGCIMDILHEFDSAAAHRIPEHIKHFRYSPGLHRTVISMEFHLIVSFLGFPQNNIIPQIPGWCP